MPRCSAIEAAKPDRVGGRGEPPATWGIQTVAAEFHWDPDQYARFCEARSRPAVELLARLPARRLRTIVDLGCGDGPVTAMLVERWPDARIAGVDSSSAMLERALTQCPTVEFVEADISTWQPVVPPDLIFSNAALHWVDDHAALFPRLATMLAPGGLFAVQMPGNFDAPSHRLLAARVRSPRWAAKLGSKLRASPVADPDRYIDWLSPVATNIDAWETTDHLLLEGENAVLEWMKGTALRPFLTALGPGDARAFLDELGADLADAYPRRPDGSTRFPFRRIYVVAERQTNSDTPTA